MAAAPNRIAEKIRKLLAIAGDQAASDAEIQNAMTHAQRLMAEHHLTEEDLSHEPQDDYAKVDGATFADHRGWIGRKCFQWESNLASFVASFVGCKQYHDPDVLTARRFGRAILDDQGRPQSGKSFVFYGVEEDAVIAAELFTELRTLIASMAAMRWGSVYKGDGGIYSEGFVSGLFQHLNESQRSERQQAGRHIDQSSTALTLIERRSDLVRYKQQKASDWLKNEKGISLVTHRSRGGAHGSGTAFREGIQDGRNAEVSASRRRKIAH